MVLASFAGSSGHMILLTSVLSCIHNTLCMHWLASCLIVKWWNLNTQPDSSLSLHFIFDIFGGEGMNQVSDQSSFKSL